MRVISGERRGKKLLAPEGTATRPTADRVKEAIFDIIQFRVAGRHALDLFAGSGQLGIEALSRGAYSCVFCETDRRAAEIIRKNLDACGFSERAEIICGDGVSALSKMGKNRFDIVFLDPPYGSDLLEKALFKICSLDLLKENGIIICETARGKTVAGYAAPYAVRKEYVYGAASVVLIEKEQL